MKKILLLILLLVTASCRTQFVPLKNDTSINYVDSVIWHDSVVVSYVTKERVVDLVNQYDTLVLETSYAKSISYVDTENQTLKGTIINKPNIPIETPIKWKERIVQRDSVVFVQTPVEVVVEKKYVPSFYKGLLIGDIIVVILLLLFIAVKIYLKFIH